jgi:hypothetical protein
MLVANIDELDSSEFPTDFQATYFPFGDPTTINLTDEADRQLAKALAGQGIERLFIALLAIPTAIAEHFLYLVLTGAAMLLYLGVPIAMLFAFFVYTQAFLVAYLRQYLNLIIETLISVIIASIMITLLAAAPNRASVSTSGPASSPRPFLSGASRARSSWRQRPPTSLAADADGWGGRHGTGQHGQPGGAGHGYGRRRRSHRWGGPGRGWGYSWAGRPPSAPMPTRTGLCWAATRPKPTAVSRSSRR